MLITAPDTALCSNTFFCVNKCRSYVGKYTLQFDAVKKSAYHFYSGFMS